MDDDEPPGICGKRLYRRIGRIIHQMRDFGIPDQGGAGQYKYRCPVVFLNYLCRGGHLVYYPGGIGSIHGMLSNRG